MLNNLMVLHRCAAPIKKNATSGGGGTSNQEVTPSPPKRKKRKFVPSPSPEGLHGHPHHPARDGKRASRALAAFSPGK